LVVVYDPVGDTSIFGLAKEGIFMHRLLKRGLVTSATLATICTPAAFLTTQAGAQVTKGAEAVNVTVYEVGTPPSNPVTSVGGGPASMGGVVVAKGTDADVPSLPTDPAGSGRSTVATPNGTITVLLTGGKFKVASLNNTTCKFIANVTKEKATVVSGTGIFSAATGSFKVNSSITGTLPRNPTGGCSETANPITDVVQASATGNINLH
jgi:hypothetical protein